MEDIDIELIRKDRIMRWIKVYAAAVILYSAYNLAGTGDIKEHFRMFKGLPSAVALIVYAFSVLYGICGVYCGSRILRFEDWARKTIVIMTSISVVSGFFLNRVIMGNFKNYIFTPNPAIPQELVAVIYRYAVIFAAVATLFELSVIFFFTRASVAEQFKDR